MLLNGDSENQNAQILAHILKMSPDGAHLTHLTFSSQHAIQRWDPKNYRRKPLRDTKLMMIKTTVKFIFKEKFIINSLS